MIDFFLNSPFEKFNSINVFKYIYTYVYAFIYVITFNMSLFMPNIFMFLKCITFSCIPKNVMYTCKMFSRR